MGNEDGVKVRLFSSGAAACRVDSGWWRGSNAQGQFHSHRRRSLTQALSLQLAKHFRFGFLFLTKLLGIL